jgi:HTH-type transcriptional regulator, sugar sensing transcriptional regulator
MDTEILEDLGLTHTEIRVYLTLLELGSSSAGLILEKSGLPNSTVHRDLNSLIEKGLINFVFEGKRKIYQATDPEHFFVFMDEKQRKFEQILPELKKKQKMAKTKENAAVYKGKRGITEVYNIMINSKGKEYNTFGGGEEVAKKMGLTWWLNIHAKRIDNKLPSRQVFDLTVRPAGGQEIEALPKTDIKYLPKEFAAFQETVIVGDKVAISLFTENPYSILIEDKNVAESYRQHFELLWKQAKQQKQTF